MSGHLRPYRSEMTPKMTYAHATAHAQLLAYTAGGRPTGKMTYCACGAEEKRERDGGRLGRGITVR